MKLNNIKSVIAIAIFCTSRFAAAEGFKLLPVLDSQYKPEATLSVVGGALSPTNSERGAYGGLELAFNCLLFDVPVGRMRTKLSAGSYSKDGSKLKMIEVNPRWTLDISPEVSVGLGPGLGVVHATRDGQSKNLLSGQVGADLDYKVGSLVLGLGARRQVTRKG